MSRVKIPTWVYPWKWLHRIEALEAENEQLRIANRVLDRAIQSQSIASAGMTVTYVSSVAAISAQSMHAYSEGQKMRIEAERNQREQSKVFSEYIERLRRDAEQKSGSTHDTG